MLQKTIRMIFGSKHERDIKKIMPLVNEINALEEKMRGFEDEVLSAQTRLFRERLKNGETLDDILPEAFATVREAGWRTLGLRMYDVQLIGGIALHQGKIAEMKTGEGKTLTSTSAIYLNALTSKGVHVVTVNDYLARRDAAWMKPIFDILGITVGAIQHDMDYDDRQDAYAADITYGTNNEFGFDYLRDNMVTDAEYQVQRSHYFAIVDEVDSILVDEARTPLIISGPTEDNIEIYSVMDKAVRRLIADEEKAPEPPPREVEPGKEEPHVFFGFYYDIDEKSKNVLLTEEGVKLMEEILEVDNLFDLKNVDLVATVNQAMRSHLIYKDEVDYIVRDNEVIIIDEFTGRTMEGRRYSDGLHQAIEAKERVEVKQETQTLASITFQNFFRIYEKLAGMTGTADTEAEEFKKIYNLDVTVIPTNLPIARLDAPDRVYGTEREKFNAIIEEIQDCRERKQPVLVGTVSVEKSEVLSSLLKKAGVPHNVLNAKQHEREAEVVENAGKPGAVTVATNMAGRGTDIVLGGYPLYTRDLENLNETEPALEKFKISLLKKQFEEARETLNEISGSARKQFAAEIMGRVDIWYANHNEVKEAGGLHILGTERHESRRIDNQLRGRSGRQGDPGSSRFYISLEDNLMRLFGGERLQNLMGRLGMKDGQELEAKMVDNAIARAQKRVESHNFDIRKHLLEYDDVMNRQREFVYSERKLLLDGAGVREHLRQWSEEVIEDQVLSFCEGNDPTRWVLEDLEEWLKLSLGVRVSLETDNYKKASNPQLQLFGDIWEECKNVYNRKVENVGDEGFSFVERRIALDVIDARWKEHLHAMDQLREGIWSISYAEKNPLVEYKLEGFRMFDEMVARTKEQVTEYLFLVEFEGDFAEVAPTRRVSGEASHQELGSFSSDPNAGGAPLAKPVSQGKTSAVSATSSGGSSKRKSSRRRRR